MELQRPRQNDYQTLIDACAQEEPKAVATKRRLSLPDIVTFFIVVPDPSLAQMPRGPPFTVQSGPAADQAVYFGRPWPSTRSRPSWQIVSNIPPGFWMIRSDMGLLRVAGVDEGKDPAPWKFIPEKGIAPG